MLVMEDSLCALKFLDESEYAQSIVDFYDTFGLDSLPVGNSIWEHMRTIRRIERPRYIRKAGAILIIERERHPEPFFPLNHTDWAMIGIALTLFQGETHRLMAEAAQRLKRKGWDYSDLYDEQVVREVIKHDEEQTESNPSLDLNPISRALLTGNVPTRILSARPRRLGLMPDR